MEATASHSQASLADPALSGALATLAQAARLLGVADVAKQATELPGGWRG